MMEKSGTTKAFEGTAVNIQLFSVLCNTFDYHFTVCDFLVMMYLYHIYKDMGEWCSFNVDISDYDDPSLCKLTYVCHVPMWEFTEDFITSTGFNRREILASVFTLQDVGVIDEWRQNQFHRMDEMLNLYIAADVIALIEEQIVHYTPPTQSEVESSMKTNNVGWVYCFYNPENTRTKIGISTDVAKRKRGMEHTIGANLEFIIAVKVAEYRSFEKLMHEYFSEYRKNGEWFELDKATVSNMKSYFEDMAARNKHNVFEWKGTL